MKILVLIPARGGSKRLPKKNIRQLGQKPLIKWSIDFAKTIPNISDILVSTDDLAIAAVAKDSGALVPWLRPPSLATDEASSLDVVLHALDWYENQNGCVDGILVLQPTTPFREIKTINSGISLFSENNHRSVVGVSKARSHPLWCFKVTQLGIEPFIDNGGFHLRSQDLPDAYEVNGSFYLASPRELRVKKTFFNNCIPLVMNDLYENIDIDTEDDWEKAESILKLGRYITM